MTTIPLTQGKTAIVDDCDAELAQLKWFASRSGNTWYARRTVYVPGGRAVTDRLHRAVWRRAHPGAPIQRLLDHSDGDGLNCRRSNLRAASRRENVRNVGRRRDNGSGFKGVRLKHRRKANHRRCWQAQIQVDGVLHSLGCFDAPEEAARAYDVAARKFFGEFAALNFPAMGESPALRGDM